MATKTRIMRKILTGYEPVHVETSADLVLMPDGRTLEAAVESLKLSIEAANGFDLLDIQVCLNDLAWVNNTARYTREGITADTKIICAPTALSWEDAIAAGINCIGAEENAIVFQRTATFSGQIMVQIFAMIKL